MATRRRTARKTRRKLKGGFYPSAYAGVEGAKFLTPLVMRQAYRLLYEQPKRRKTRRRRI